jgi:hypothetical protein
VPRPHLAGRLIATFVVGLVGLVGLVGCSRDHGPPRPQPTPTPDRVAALRTPGARSPRLANYKLDARLDAVHHQLVATETLTWTNGGASPVDALPFHLYLNAFKNDASLFMRSSGGVMRGARASTTGWGWIQIDSAKVGEVELVGKLRYLPPDETVAELPLPTPLAPGASIEIAFRFTAQLPEVFARTGYAGEFLMVGQWFPKIGVRVGVPGAERWECQPLHANTEFFADFGTYDVTLTVPSTLVVAATGVLTAAADGPGGTHVLTYRAEDVHDFAWMADPYMEVVSGTAKVAGGDVEVRVYHRPGQAAFAHRHLEAGIATIERMSAWFTPYPWTIMSIIDPPPDAADGAGGMEYPTLVTTSGDGVFMRPGIRIPEYVTVHEVGHNWFQGLLASNEGEEAWLDEGVNEWADAKVMDDRYGPRASLVDWGGWQASGFELRQAVAEDPASLPSPIAAAAYAFVDNAAYGEQSYATTMRALRTLELMVGSDAFMKAMATYVRTWAFRHPTGQDLFASLATSLDRDLTAFFGPVFHEVGGLDLRIRHAACEPTHPPRGVFGDGPARKTMTEVESPASGGFRCEVVIANTGRYQLPVDVELRFVDGSSQRLRWEPVGSQAWQRFEVERSAPLAEVRLDPDDKLALDAPMGHAWRLDGDGAASLRAAARIAAWTQSLMQVVGP